MLQHNMLEAPAKLNTMQQLHGELHYHGQIALRPCLCLFVRVPVRCRDVNDLQLMIQG